MYWTQTPTITETVIYRQPDPVIRLVARRFALSPETEHLPMLVDLFVELEKAGVALEQHLECAIEGLIEELK